MVDHEQLGGAGTPYDSTMDPDIDKNEALLFTIGIVGTTLNTLCILYNILLTVILYKGRGDYMSHPFYRAAPHLIISETAMNLLLIILVAPCLLSRRYYYPWYDNNIESWLIAIPNSLMMSAFDSYYAFQLLIAFYRFITMNAGPKVTQFFSVTFMRTACMLLWIWYIAEGGYMVGGICTKLYRPTYHFIGIYCSDYYEDVADQSARWHILWIIQFANIAIPIISMSFYVALYIKVYIYQQKTTIIVQGTEESEEESPRRSTLTLIWEFIKPDNDDSSVKSQQIRIVYQGLALLFLLTIEPINNVIHKYFKRDQTNPYAIVWSYFVIYVSSFPNFIVFFVFNTQIRREFTNIFQTIFCKERNRVTSLSLIFKESA